MKLTDYQKNNLIALRKELRDEDVSVFTITTSGGTSGDGYGIGKTVTETSVTIEGKICWGVVFEKNETTGGFIEIGNCQVLISIDDKVKVNQEKVYLKTDDNIKLEVVKIIPAKNTGECVLTCKIRK